MDCMNRLERTNEFVPPQFGSANARELAKRWKEDGKLPLRLAIAWMSKGLVALNAEEKSCFKRDKKDRKNVGKVWRSLGGETQETLGEMVERQLREGGASRLRGYAFGELKYINIVENDKKAQAGYEPSDKKSLSVQSNEKPPCLLPTHSTPVIVTSSIVSSDERDQKTYVLPDKRDESQAVYSLMNHRLEDTTLASRNHHNDNHHNDNHAWERLVKTKDFESTEAREMAKKWTRDRKIPRRLADAWKSKGLVSKNDEEKQEILRDEEIRVNAGRVWLRCYGNTRESLDELVERQLEGADAGDPAEVKRNGMEQIESKLLMIHKYRYYHKTRVSTHNTSDDSSITASLSAMERLANTNKILAKTNKFVAPPMGSAEARELAMSWKEEGRLPSRLAIAWMSKNLAPRNQEENLWFTMDRIDRNSVSQVWRNLGETTETLNNMVERQLRKGGASRLREFTVEESKQVVKNDKHEKKFRKEEKSMNDNSA